MRNEKHRRLIWRLKTLRKDLKFLVCQSLFLKLEINKLGRVEERLIKIQKRKSYRDGITWINQEIRKLKMEIRECQRNFG